MRMVIETKFRLCRPLKFWVERKARSCLWFRWKIRVSPSLPLFFLIKTLLNPGHSGARFFSKIWLMTGLGVLVLLLMRVVIVFFVVILMRLLFRTVVPICNLTDRILNFRLSFIQGSNGSHFCLVNDLTGKCLFFFTLTRPVFQP